MKNLKITIISLICLSATLYGCEDVIDLEVQDGVPQLVVDAWITNEAKVQEVRLSISQAYFDNSAPKPALNAEVVLFNQDSTAYTFLDPNKDGVYTFDASKNSPIKIGNQYALYIKYDGEEYYSISKVNRVPKIDSLTFEAFSLPIAPTDGSAKDGFIGEFYARDFEGENDTYWIKSYKNGKFRNAPSQITTAYDAGFSPRAKTDGLLFILPIRQSINDNSVSQDKDTLKVELLSITNEAFYYLQLVNQESTNGGIFATPPANIPTNIINLNANSLKKPLGFFGMSAVSSFQAIVDKNKARPKK